VYTGKGDGSFKLAGSYTLAEGSFLADVCLADVLGTGKLAIVATQWSGINGNSKVDSVEGGIVLMAGNGDGTFQNPVNLVLPSAQPPVSNRQWRFQRGRPAGPGVYSGSGRRGGRGYPCFG